MTWAPKLIGEYVQSGEIELQTGPFGTQLKASEYTPEGTPVINVRNIGYGKLRQEKLEFIPEEVCDRLENHKLRSKDIVFGRKGAVDRHLFVTDEQNTWVQGSDCIRLRVNSKAILPEFLSYSFLSSFHKNWMLAQCGNKATMASLNQDIICRIPVRVPDIPTQTEIIKVIKQYDNLIENNRRRIELLEQSARLLYREWFVYFCFPGHEHVEIQDGVPEGWGKKELKSIAKVNRASLKKGHDGIIEYIDISSVGTDSIGLSAVLDFKKAPSRARRMLQHGDIIWSCVRPNRRSHAVVMHPKPNLIASTGFAVISPLEVPTSFLYQALTTNDYVGYLTNNARGAAYPAVTAKDFNNSEILVPSAELIHSYDDIVHKTMEMKHTLAIQNIALAQARDLLLPRLMNGDIAV